jgi:hypothetical protein
MHTLRIEHPVSNYDTWKAAFDSDPIGREHSGVRRYRILRPTDDPNYVMIDLEFDSASEAEAVHAELRDPAALRLPERRWSRRLYEMNRFETMRANR